MTESDFRSVRELADAGEGRRYWNDDQECEAAACSLFGTAGDAEDTRKAFGALRKKVVAYGRIDGPGKVQHTPSKRSQSHHSWWRGAADAAWVTFEVSQ